jgi:hypothetical protein
MKFVQQKKKKAPATVKVTSGNKNGKSGLRAGATKLRLASDEPTKKKADGFEFLKPPSKQAKALGKNASFFENLARGADDAGARDAGARDAGARDARTAGGAKSVSSSSSSSSSGGSSSSRRSSAGSSVTSLSLSSVSSGSGGSHDMEIFRGLGEDDSSVMSSASSLDAELRMAEEEQEKEILLARMHALKQRGVKLAKNYTVKSSLHELRMEWKRLEYETTTSRSVQRLRRWMLMLVSAAQFACDSSYAPGIIKGKLNGFSDYILSNIDEFDPVFERMADRYGGIAGIGSTGNPFADLGILMLTQLAMFFFVSNSRPGTKAPSAEEIQEKYPDAVRDAATKMAEEMRRKDELLRRQQERQQQQDMAAVAAHDFSHSAFQPAMLYPPLPHLAPHLAPVHPLSPPRSPPRSPPPFLPPLPPSVELEEETFPVKGTGQLKVIDLPESAATRRGRPPKINAPPKRSSSTPPADKLDKPDKLDNKPDKLDKPERTEIVVV